MVSHISFVVSNIKFPKMPKRVAINFNLVISVSYLIEFHISESFNIKLKAIISVCNDVV